MILAGLLTCVLLLTFPPKKGSGFVVCNEHPPIGELSLQLREQFQNIQFRIINSELPIHTLKSLDSLLIPSLKKAMETKIQFKSTTLL
jgi:hypothetical protein